MDIPGQVLEVEELVVPPAPGRHGVILLLCQGSRTVVPLKSTYIFLK
jgi:hypothetical protein